MVEVFIPEPKLTTLFKRTFGLFCITPTLPFLVVVEVQIQADTRDSR